MKVNVIVGIDPGANGGIAVYKPGNKTKVVKMPKDINDFRAYLNEFLKEYGEPLIFLEKLNVRPDDISVEADGKANMGKLYRIQKMIAQFEQLKATIAATGIPYVLVHSMKWQNELKLRINRKGFKEEKKDRKKRYCKIAGDLYPEIKTTLWNADALLIMHFGRVILQNNQRWIMENLPNAIGAKLF